MLSHQASHQASHTAGTTTCQAEFVARLDDAVRHDARPTAVVRAVTGVLTDFLDRSDLLAPEQCIGDPAGYRQRVLYVAPDGAFSVVALVWLPGQATPIHDHLSWCVVGVHRGEESETRYRLVDDRCLAESQRVTNVTGSVAGLVPPGDIHQVTNAGDGVAISIHVYGADLRQQPSSIRRCYELPVVA